MSGLPGPFDFIKSISETKEDMMVDEASEKAYNSFLVNRGLSYYPDTVLLANEMNRLHHLGSRPKYVCLLNSIRRRKRFSKWFKAEDEATVRVVREYYSCSNDKARSIARLLTAEQIDELGTRLSKGGRQTGRVDKRLDAGGSAA